MKFIPASKRYEQMQYRNCGNSGIKLPALSLGLWHNFGHKDHQQNFREIILGAFDAGITHFDLANNYGPPPGAAEENFGKILRSDLASYRDELIISTKAGYFMWPGPYGDGGSRKYLLSSLEQSLARMGIDHVDIFYHHRPDPDTPIEETMTALEHAVKSGKALYAGISNYPADKTQEASNLLKSLGTPCLIHQPRYSMLVRDPEKKLLEVLDTEGIGCIPFSPLAQGLLTKRYLGGIPDDSRAALDFFLKKKQITPELIKKTRKLDAVAKDRQQSLAQMSLAWLLKDRRISSVLIGASSLAQLHDNLGALANPVFNKEELQNIENILSEE